MELVGGFGFHDQLPVNNHVEALLGEVVSLIKDLDGDLAGHAVLARDKLTLQSHHIYMLEESIAQIVVNLEECPDH
jgi:hypothetical protein